MIRHLILYSYKLNINTKLFKEYYHTLIWDACKQNKKLILTNKKVETQQLDLQLLMRSSFELLTTACSPAHTRLRQLF